MRSLMFILALTSIIAISVEGQQHKNSGCQKADTVSVRGPQRILRDGKDTIPSSNTPSTRKKRTIPTIIKSIPGNWPDSTERTEYSRSLLRQRDSSTTRRK